MTNYLEEDYLEHFGVKGMRWGVRNTPAQLSGVPRKTNRMAQKDAKEFVRAKMFYGEGAGNRRKLIKNSVASKSSNLAGYKKAFEYHLGQQDIDQHVSKAISERRVKDVKNKTAKTARGIKNTLLGNPKYATVTAIGITLGAKYVHSKGYDKQALHYMRRSYVQAKNSEAATTVKRLFTERKWM